MSVVTGRSAPIATSRVVLCTVVVVLVACTTFVAADEGGGSCDTISSMPRDQQCSFLRAQCPSESLVPYAEWYYCYLAPHNVLLRSVYLAVVCCLLPLAFCLLGDTAEFYIAPIMAHVSQAIPKMRPRFAGVTFVALGNGAPDLSANIAAISAGEVTLSAGAFTGAAMFVQCIVAAELLSLAGDAGIKCGGAMLRDVGVYCLAIFSVLVAFTLGQISHAFVGWAIALYVLYMIWVFAGDEWHQRGRPKPQLDSQSFKNLLSMIASGGAATANADQSAHRSGRDSSSSSRAQVRPSTRGDLEESLLPWAVAEDEEFTGDGFSPYGAANTSFTTRGVPPDFEVQQPSRPSSSASLGLASGQAMPSGSPGTPSGLLAMQLSTELAPASRALRSADTGSNSSTSRRHQQLKASRRTSAPIPAVRGTAVHSEGGYAESSSVVPSPSGTQRHSSVPSASGTSWRQPWLLRTNSSSWATRPQSQQGGVSGCGAAGMHPHLVSLGQQSYIDPKTYKQLVWADLADDQEEEARLEREIARQLLRDAGPSSAAGGMTGSYQPPGLVSSATSTPRGQQPAEDAHLLAQALPHQPNQQHTSLQQLQTDLQASSRVSVPQQGPSAAAMSQAQQLPEGGEHHVQAVAAADQLKLPVLESAADTGGLPARAQAAQPDAPHHQQVSLPAEHLNSSADDVWQQLQWQVTLGNSEEWSESGHVQQLFRKVTYPLLLPAYLGQRLTIPFVSSAGYSREWLISSLLCSPLAMLAYLGAFSMPGVLTACALGIGAAVVGALLTAWDQPDQLAVQGLGGRAATAVPGVLAVWAFCMAIVWIDTIATEVVAVVTFLAGLAGLPSGVMGLTLLAWGNSLGDYFGNRAMAKAGHTSTAITACFAAPLFNMLISLACGFSSYLHKLGTASVKVTLRPEVVLGCIFLISYNAAIICVGRLCGWRLPPWFRHFARAWYALYFALAVASGFQKPGTSD